jgi:hypothetical protein
MSTSTRHFILRTDLNFTFARNLVLVKDNLHRITSCLVTRPRQFQSID